MSSSVIPPSPEPTSSKRKASTSAPFSPTTLRPAQKRLAFARLLPHLNSTILLPLRPAKALVPSTAWHLFPLKSDVEMDFDLGSASDRSVSVSSQNTYSLASGSSNAPASGRRAKQDAADAKRVLRTIKQVKENTYKVKKGGPSGKYLIQRTLHHSGYKLLQKELNKPENRDLLEPLAIVGLFLKFPQDATSPDEFWKMILEKRCAMTEFPSDRFNIDAFYGLDNSRADTVSIFV